MTVTGFGAPGAQLVVDRAYQQAQRCAIVRADGPLERVRISFPGYKSEAMLAVRDNNEQWLITVGNCGYRLDPGPVYVHSPSRFAGPGAEIIGTGSYPSRCLILSATRR